MTRKLLRRFSELDLGRLARAGASLRTRSEPASLMQAALGAAGTQDPVSAKVQADLHAFVAHIHNGIKTVSDADPAMAPGLAVVGALTRSDEWASFRKLFIAQPGLAVGKLIFNATETTLSPAAEAMLSKRFLRPAERALLIDLLMTDTTTANLLKLLSTKRSFLRLGLKMRRAMLVKNATEGRAPELVGYLTPIETLQASALLFKKENITPLQTTIDTILLGIGGEVPALVGGLIQELFVDDKVRLSGFAATLGTRLGAEMQAFVTRYMPHNAVDYDLFVANQTLLLNKLFGIVWNDKVAALLVGKYFGPQYVTGAMSRLKAEGVRISQMAERVAAARGLAAGVQS